MAKYIAFLSFIISLISCKNDNPEYYKMASDPEMYHQSMKMITDVMVHDIFSPPVASRIYTYSSIAGYEAVRWQNPEKYPTLSGKISHFMPVVPPDSNATYCYEMSGVIAMLKVGRTLIFSEDSINKQLDKVLNYYRETGMPRDIFERSQAFGDSVAAHVIRWSSKDNYKQSRSFAKYSIQNNPATWRPTPPGYMDGVEPSWNKIRTMVADSASQFKPEPPTPFNMKDKNSRYYQEATEVYLTVKNATEEQRAIANFWDCNPYKLNVTGHVMHATKKISPGGHWINITGLACRKAAADMPESARAYSLVSVGLFEAFISCCDEKYRSAAIRPETVINEYIDPEWLPELQTPPFPEYTSGHSVASSTSAVILTRIFGDDFAFTDDTETEFGLDSRSFTSFNHAAEEASISRLYGGIHFMPAITNGVQQGRGIGQLVLDRLAPVGR
jgi:hypothetical protein